MKHINPKKALKPSSYIILSELAEASRLFEQTIEKGTSLRTGAAQYEAVSAAAEEKLNALALQDPDEATRIFVVSPYFDETIDPDQEVYLGHYVFMPREELDIYNTPEKRAKYLREAIEQE